MDRDRRNFDAHDYRIEEWVSSSELQAIQYSTFWNDESEEQHKAWNVLDGNFGKMEEHLQESDLLGQLNRALQVLRTEFGRTLSGSGADLACGTMWAVPHLLDQAPIDRLYCVEMSRHRLLTIGPKMLEHYGVPQERVVLCLGSFYHLRLPDESLEFVLLSQAFHHASEPERLLGEIGRILKPGGIAVVIGEHMLHPELKSYVRHFAGFFISELMPESMQKRLLGRVLQIRTMLLREEDLASSDEVLGDHYYTSSQYQDLFSGHGFKLLAHFKANGVRMQSFILMREDKIA